MSSDAQFEQGASALDVLKEIVRSRAEISRVEIFKYKVKPINWRQAHPSIREKLEALRESFQHNPAENSHSLQRAEFSQLAQDALVDHEGFEWAIRSLVACSDGSRRHIPMMNFHTPRDLGNPLDHVEQIIEFVVPKRPGVILASGRHYHYYGGFLLDEVEWPRFLGEFLMPCVLISPRYVGHSLVDGHCPLRVTANTEHKSTVPRVVRVLSAGGGEGD